MANVYTSAYLQSSKKESVLYITLDSDGTDEVSKIIYDSSVVNALNNVPDTLNSKIASIACVTRVSSTGTIKLYWNATIDVLAYTIPTNTILTETSFRYLGSLTNTSGAGKTGDILLKTTGLKKDDSLTLIICVRNS